MWAYIFGTPDFQSARHFAHAPGQVVPEFGSYRFLRKSRRCRRQQSPEYISVARTIFERYGGFAKISRVVMSFYDRILESPVTSPYFEHTDMRRLIDHQTRFVSYVMGGPASYTNDHLERVHARLGITEEAFNEMTALLRETLEDYDFAGDDIDAVMDEISSRKNFIVAR